jgi:hypothetical protein
MRKKETEIDRQTEDERESIEGDECKQKWEILE